jgi:hypothetical protein
VDKRNAAAGIFPPGSLSVSGLTADEIHRLFLSDGLIVLEAMRADCGWMTGKQEVMNLAHRM